jgi:hypothetical protein
LVINLSLSLLSLSFVIICVQLHMFAPSSQEQPDRLERLYRIVLLLNLIKICICCRSKSNMATRANNAIWLGKPQSFEVWSSECYRVCIWVKIYSNQRLWNWYNVSIMSTWGLLFSVGYHYTNSSKCVDLVQSGHHHHHFIET